MANRMATLAAEQAVPHVATSIENLPELLLQHAREQPDSIAVVAETGSLTYQELAERTRDLAHYLRYLGVGPDHCVGIFVEPSLDLMVGAWGILAAGGAYLPLSPEYPTERLRYMITDSRISVILCQEKFRREVATLVPRATAILTLKDAEAFASAHRPCSTCPPERPIDRGNLAYVIYTSGSTGKPKGVMIEHRSIANQMHWFNTAYRLHGSTVLQKTPMSFDAAQWEILAPGCGATVVMARPGAYRDPDQLVETIIEHGVTMLQCVPTLLQAIVDTERLHECTSLTHIFSGGESLSKALALRCLKVLPTGALVNLYGPTECTINSSARAVDPSTVADGPNAIPIGTPVSNTHYFILDAHASPVDVGEIGELHIGGVQVARGYLNRPDLVAAKFVDSPFSNGPNEGRLFKTGDLAYWDADGAVHFAGRADNQVKLRGFRVELDEIRTAIETHGWVKHAGVVVKPDPRNGFQNLLAFVELNAKEAALMDQGNHGAHHQSKQSRLQTRAQLSNSGCRSGKGDAGRRVVELPGRAPSPEQRRLVFARKTYRFFEGGDVAKTDILRLLEERHVRVRSRRVESLTLVEIGTILRYFGQFLSDERLLPKYGYASPGSLYATQMYFELANVAGLDSGYYYYHPVHHQLVLIAGITAPEGPESTARIHFVGKRRAIEPVYKDNIREVLEIETGHMVGLLDEVLPAYGLGINPSRYEPSTIDHLDCYPDDLYLGSFEIAPHAQRRQDKDAVLDIYVQAHPGRVAGLPAAQYHYRDGALEKISGDFLLKKHVIAINQQVYERSSIGITVMSKVADHWMSYVSLGRELQRLQMNHLNLGFMSSGYSSKTGNDLPSASRIAGILHACGKEAGPSYFFVGGRVSDEQLRSEGMNEDVVHMRGPAEMIKDDLASFLPDYMIPNRVIILNGLPRTVNGKIDMKALAELDAGTVDRPFVEPRTETESRLCDLWKAAVKCEAVSVRDDFFELGGNSLLAVGVVNKVNKAFGSWLPLQVLFEAPTIEKLARKLDSEHRHESSRLVALKPAGSGNAIFCWPGLGGYPMNLRLLASRLAMDRPFYGVQAHGVNAGEVPYRTIEKMAAEDVLMITRVQPTGPYMLWGYSFGARVAFEAAYQLEQSGEEVEHLFLIAPGSPKVVAGYGDADAAGSVYSDPRYVSILFSVFAGTISHTLLDECLRRARDEDRFVSFIEGMSKELDSTMIRRIVRIVERTYQARYVFDELIGRHIDAPITIFKATGDDYSFIEGRTGYCTTPPTFVDLEVDHYGVLKDPGVGALVRQIHNRLRREFDWTDGAARRQGKEQTVPHVNIKHFPAPLTSDEEAALVEAVTEAVTTAFKCDEGVISVALEAVEKEAWTERVYVPEIVNRRDLLRRRPNY